MRNENNFSTGVCKCFGRDFGFLIEDGSNEEIFVHYSSILSFEPREFRVLVPGRRYRFQRVESPRKPGTFIGMFVEELEGDFDYDARQSHQN
jgi:cold shock CspA family protein